MADKKKNYLGLIMLAVILLIFFIVIQRHYRYLGQLKEEIINYRNQMDEYNVARSEKPSVTLKKETVIKSVESVKLKYFSPFLQENVLLKVNELFRNANVIITSMTFSAPQITEFGNEDDTETGTQGLKSTFPDTFEKGLTGSKEDVENVDESKYLINLARQKYKSALELMTGDQLDENLLVPEEVNYSIPKVDLTINFTAPDYKSIVLLNQNLERNTQKIYISSLNLLKAQTEWTGNMTLHFYILD